MNNENNEKSAQEIEVELLNKAYKGVDMGVKAAEELLKMTKDNDFAALIKSHLNGYMEFKTRLSKLICDCKKVPSGINSMENAMFKMSVITKTAMNKTTQILSKMAFQGTNMGVLEMCQIINSRKLSAENEAFMHEILLEYENYVGELKAFL